MFLDFIKTNEHVALIHKNDVVTYNELYQRICFTMSYLLEKDIVKGSKCIVYLPRSIDQIVYILSLFSIGAIYVPVSINDSYEKLSYYLSCINPEYIITTKSLQSNFNRFRHSMVLTDDRYLCSNSKKSVHTTLVLEDPLYYIFSSGTTGTPNISILTLESLQSLMTTVKTFFKWKEEDMVLQLCECSFGIHIREILGSLFCGSTLVLLEEGDLFDFGLLGSKLSLVSRVFFTSTYFSDLFDSLKDCLFSNIKYVTFGGEPCYKKTLLKATTIFPNAFLSVSYGTSELAVHCFYNEISDLSSLDNSEPVPIGYPRPGLIVNLSDNDYGEMELIGRGFSIGYLNKEGGPTWKNDLQYYNTGDIVKKLNSGKYQFVSRRDSQIKINGKRIELEEVKHLILEHPHVLDCVVFFKQEIICIVKVDQSRKIDEIFEKEITFLLKTRFDLSFRILLVYIYPKNLSGKILIDPLTNKSPIFSPSNQEELILYDIWYSILGHSYFTADTNFRDIANSIQYSTLLSKLKLHSRHSLSSDELLNISTFKSQVKLLTSDVFEVVVRSEKTKSKASYSQELFFWNDIYHSRSYDSHIIVPCTILKSSMFDWNSFKYKIKTIIAHHPSLITKFIFEDNTLYQYHSDRDLDEIFSVNIDFNSFISNTIDVTKDFPVKVLYDESNSRVIFVFHHICFDGKSLDIFFKDLFYMKYTSKLPYRYIDFTIYENDRIKENDESIVFWNEYLSVLKNKPSYRQPKSSNACEKVIFLDYPFKITTSLINLLSSFLYFCIYPERQYVCFNNVCSNRYGWFENTVGCFINSFPFIVSRQDISKKLFEELIESFSFSFSNVIKHSSMPFKRLEQIYPNLLSNIDWGINCNRRRSEIGLVKVDNSWLHLLEEEDLNIFRTSFDCTISSSINKKKEDRLVIRIVYSSENIFNLLNTEHIEIILKQVLNGTVLEHISSNLNTDIPMQIKIKNTHKKKTFNIN